MIYDCEKHGLTSPLRVCSHFYNRLVSVDATGEFHVTKFYLRNTIRGQDYVGDVFVCDDCAEQLALETKATYDYQLLSEEKKHFLSCSTNFFCGECVDEWMASSAVR